LNGNFADAYQLSELIRAHNLQIYITQELQPAKDYLQKRYEGQSTKRYGLLMSSETKNLGQVGGSRLSKELVGHWYNAAPSDRRSCCQLDRVASEFECQGLKLDLPVVCGG